MLSIVTVTPPTVNTPLPLPVIWISGSDSSQLFSRTWPFLSDFTRVPALIYRCGLQLKFSVISPDLFKNRVSKSSGPVKIAIRYSSGG